MNTDQGIKPVGRLSEASNLPNFEPQKGTKNWRAHGPDNAPIGARHSFDGRTDNFCASLWPYSDA